jgi:hypothetical protein
MVAMKRLFFENRKGFSPSVTREVAAAKKVQKIDRWKQFPCLLDIIISEVDMSTFMVYELAKYDLRTVVCNLRNKQLKINLRCIKDIMF